MRREEHTIPWIAVVLPITPRPLADVERSIEDPEERRIGGGLDDAFQRMRGVSRWLSPRTMTGMPARRAP